MDNVTENDNGTEKATEAKDNKETVQFGGVIGGTEFPRKSHEGGTPCLYGYSVEARFGGYTNGRSRRVNDDFILTTTWQKIPFETGAVGVPAQNWGLDRHLAVIGLMSYDAAQALRWWFLASLNTDYRGSLCVETRLVQHKVRVSWEATAIRECDAFLGDDTRYQEQPRPEAK
jgi:hypothetical protein